MRGLGRSAAKGGWPFSNHWASLVAQLVKNPPAMWETWVQSLGWEDPLEKGKDSHSSILAWVAKSRTQPSDSLSGFHFHSQSHGTRSDVPEAPGGGARA